MADDGSGNMRACGCPKGRPCTCEMGKAGFTHKGIEFACGVCVNCRLNARKNRKEVRKCLKYSEYVHELGFDRIELDGDCVFRMRKPTWDTDTKSAFFNRMHQMRLAWQETRTTTVHLLDQQRKLRKKLNRDLVKAQEALQRIEELKKTGPLSAQKTMKDVHHVDSDVFDSHSKQLIPVETLVPDLRARLEKANATILTEERNLKIIGKYVEDVAATRIQVGVREFLRLQRWKQTFRSFREDVTLAAAVEIQATYRMYQGKKTKRCLLELQAERRRHAAANCLRRLSLRLRAVRSRKVQQQQEEAIQQAKIVKSAAAQRLQQTLVQILLHRALVKWKETQREATKHEQKRHWTAVVLIQRMYRGFRDRLALRRLRCRDALTPRVRELMEMYLIHGDLWGFLTQVNADYRRFMNDQEEERENAKTFVSTVLQRRQEEEDRMLEDWFHLTAVQSPIVQRLHDPLQQYDRHRQPHKLQKPMLVDALTQAPLSNDLVQLSNESDVFPEELPPKTIRLLMAEGFELQEIIAVLYVTRRLLPAYDLYGVFGSRGLRAQGKNLEDLDLVHKTLQSRTPLMTNPWKSERMVKETTTSSLKQLATTTKKRPLKKRSKSPDSSKPVVHLPTTANSFITRDLIHSIPGGMNGPISRLVLVAGLRCFDPTADSGNGAFVSIDDAAQDPFESYLTLPSSLLKIRREHAVMDAAHDTLRVLTSHGLFTAYDLLNRVRGVQQLLSWGVPVPLAHSMYDVITELHRQSIQMSRRFVRQQLVLTPSFQSFVQERKQEDPVVDAAPASPISDRRATKKLKQELKSQLYDQVLELPLASIDVRIHDALFKSAFLVVSDDHQDLQTPENQAFDAFVDQLVQLRVAHNPVAQRQLIEHRTHRALAMARRYDAILTRSGIQTIGGLLNVKSKTVLRQLPPALAHQLSILMAPLRKSRPLPEEPPQKTRSPAVSPLLRHRPPIVLMPDSLQTLELPNPTV